MATAKEQGINKMIRSTTSLKSRRTEHARIPLKARTIRVQTKEKAADLAIAGGIPAFAEPLHVGAPNIPDRGKLLARINDMLDRRWLSNDGPFVRDFEQRIAEYVGVRNCVAVCNATIGIQLAATALGLRGEVIVPAFTFVATAHALLWQGIQPVFCDVDPQTFTLNPGKLESCLSNKTTGILGVHLWGRPCGVGALKAFADANGLRLIFDAAHAFGCSLGGRMVGGFGDAEVFSFHATKFLNSFEGGAVVTNDDELAGRLRLMRNFGFQGYDNVIYLGTNAKMSEISAAMGLTSLESIDEVIAVNKLNYGLYNRELTGIPGISQMRYEHDEKCNYQYMIFEIDAELYGLSRDELMSVLHSENILARRYFYPGCHRMEPYRSMPAGKMAILPVTDRLAARVIALPTGTAVAEEQIDAVCRIIRLAHESSAEIRRKLRIHPLAKGVEPIARSVEVKGNADGVLSVE
jgi:dTDP-4-amino-4,6-dideoxygalactose transaminase